VTQSTLLKVYNNCFYFLFYTDLLFKSQKPDLLFKTSRLRKFNYAVKITLDELLLLILHKGAFLICYFLIHTCNRLVLCLGLTIILKMVFFRSDITNHIESCTFWDLVFHSPLFPTHTDFLAYLEKISLY